MKKIIFAFVLLMILFIIGCSNSLDDVKELEDIDVRLKWNHQAQFTGNYFAKESGLYESFGLNVTLIEYDFINSPIKEVQEGNAQFGICSSDELILAKSRGLADDVKAIAVIYKMNPVTLFSFKEDNIEKPEDLVGKIVGVEKASDGSEVNIGISFNALVKKLNLKNITEVKIGYDAKELLSGEVDVSSGYLINEPYYVIKEGYEINNILPAEYGLNIYADIIITNDKLIEERPELVWNFLRSTILGWLYSFEDKEQAVDYVMKYSANATRDHQNYMLETSFPLINTGDSEIGLMDEESWDLCQNIMYDQGFIKDKLQNEDLFTNQFFSEMIEN